MKHGTSKTKASELIPGIVVRISDIVLHTFT